jgi:hypothetical protein
MAFDEITKDRLWVWTLVDGKVSCPNGWRIDLYDPDSFFILKGAYAKCSTLTCCNCPLVTSVIERW